jgi:hypothetical protein
MSSASEIALGNENPQLKQLPANEDLIDDAGKVSVVLFAPLKEHGNLLYFSERINF